MNLLRGAGTLNGKFDQGSLVFILILYAFSWWDVETSSNMFRHSLYAQTILEDVGNLILVYLSVYGFQWLSSKAFFIKSLKCCAFGRFLEDDFDTYVGRMRQPHVWGGEPELLMSSHVLKLVAGYLLFQTSESCEVSVILLSKFCYMLTKSIWNCY